MPIVAVVFHSGFGHTKALAESVARGAASVKDIESRLISAEELPNPDSENKLRGRWDEVTSADAIIFGCPTYMGSVTSELKRVFEAASSLWFQQAWKDKFAAGFTTGGGMSGDKLNCLQDLSQFAAQHSMIWVSLGCMPDGTGPNNLNRISSWLGMMAQSDNAPPEETPPPGDHKTAEHLGARVASITSKFLS